jgi:hypothetical protein
MSVHVIKVHGNDVPEELRESGVAEAFCVEDDTGKRHYSADDLEAAKLAVALNEEAKANEEG